MYITEPKEFSAFLEHAATRPVLAIDTEFMRERTYWPRLCLLQLATDEQAVAVDPFKVKDLKPLVELLLNPSVTKLFHAARQDIEILVHTLGVAPKPLFDTQVAAALLGHTQQMGYAPLVQSECGVRLRKADSFTDWTRRPLTNSQIQYALDDVIYLPPMYANMKKKLEDLGRLHWLDADFEAMSDVSKYQVVPEERYIRLKRVNQLSGAQLACAQHLAAWRERTAMRRDIPRKWLLTDEQIVEACKREPKTIDELFMVRGISNSLNTRDAREALAACKEGLSAPESEWPHLAKPGKTQQNVDAQVDLLSALVRLRARENDVAYAVLASHDDLVHIARGQYGECEVLQGWRKHMVGDELVELAEGRLSVCIDRGVLKVTKRRHKTSR